MALLLLAAAPTWATWNSTPIQMVTSTPDTAWLGSSLTFTLTSANSTGPNGAFTTTGTGNLLFAVFEVHNVGVMATQLTAVSGGGTWVILPSSACNAYLTNTAVLDCAYVLSDTPTSSIQFTRSNDDSGTAVAKVAVFEIGYTAGPIGLDPNGGVRTVQLTSSSTTQPGVSLGTLTGANDIVFQFICAGAGQALESSANPPFTSSIINDHLGVAISFNTLTGNPPVSPFWGPSSGTGSGVAVAVAFTEQAPVFGHCSACELSRLTTPPSLGHDDFCGACQ